MHRLLKISGEKIYFKWSVSLLFYFHFFDIVIFITSYFISFSILPPSSSPQPRPRSSCLKLYSRSTSYRTYAALFETWSIIWSSSSKEILMFTLTSCRPVDCKSSICILLEQHFLHSDIGVSIAIALPLLPRPPRDDDILNTWIR